MEKSQEHVTQLNYAKTSSLLFLRNQDKAYKIRMKRHGRMIKRKKYLKEKIYGPTIKFNRKAAQNIIWQKNYKLKMAINILREDNCSLKAKLWNIQKQNRKMDKQIESWNLQKVFSCSNKKPYIDMATVSKVFADQDYQIVSTKIDIAHFEQILQQKQQQIQRLTTKSKQFQKHHNHTKHISSQQKCKLLTAIKIQNIQQNQTQFDTQFSRVMENLNQQVVLKNERTDFLKKNIQLKKKVNIQHLVQRQNLQKQCHNFKCVNEQQIQTIKQQMRKLKLEQQNTIKDMKKDLRNLKKDNVKQECVMQQQMGIFIMKKIELNQEIDNLLKKINAELGDAQIYQSQILPAIKNLQL